MNWSALVRTARMFTFSGTKALQLFCRYTFTTASASVSSGVPAAFTAITLAVMNGLPKASKAKSPEAVPASVSSGAGTSARSNRCSNTIYRWPVGWSKVVITPGRSSVGVLVTSRRSSPNVWLTTFSHVPSLL